MIDIVCFKDKKLKEFGKKLGFSDVYSLNDFKIIRGGDEKSNRKAVENKDIDILLHPEKNDKKDFMKSRNSGLNQVLCKIAKKNDVAIGFSFNEILKSSRRSLLIGRMRQNIKLCRKYKVRMVFASFAKSLYEMRGAKDLFSLAQVLGMSPGEAKKALNFTKK